MDRTSLTGPQLAAAQSTFIDAFHIALLVCAAFAALGVLTALVRGQEHPSPASGVLAAPDMSPIPGSVE
jgi:hypothetical protein